MKYNLAIFDLDGTILDTLEDLQRSLNHALKSCGYPERTYEEVRLFLGNGAINLVERSVPEGTGEAERMKVLEIFNQHYSIHCNDSTGPYDGITALLQSLRTAGMNTAVVSNKPDYGVQTLCAQHFEGLFDCVAGVKEGIRRKPAPDAVNAVLRELNIDKEKAVYIGDSEVDIATAQNAEMDCISVDWGFRDRAALMEAGAEIIVSGAAQLQQILLKD